MNSHNKTSTPINITIEEQPTFQHDLSSAMNTVSNSFNAEQDLPMNPRPGDTVQGADGSQWFAVDGNTWAEYEMHLFGGASPTGKIIDLRNRKLNSIPQTEKVLEKSVEKTATCLPWNHKWKLYESIISKSNNFDYCEVCDEKRKPQ